MQDGGQGFSLKQKAGTKAGPAVQAGEDRLQPDPSPKKLRSLPQKTFFPAPRPETFGKPFFWRCGAALPPRAVPKNATLPAGVSLPCRAEGTQSPPGVFFTGRFRKRNEVPARVFLPSRFLSRGLSSAPRQGRARLLRFCAAAHRSPARRAPPQSPWTPFPECR